MRRSLALLPVLIGAMIIAAFWIRAHATPVGIGTEPSIVSFTATPPVAKPGEPVILAWNARGASSLDLDRSTQDRPSVTEPEQTKLPDSGRITVHPKQNTAYILTCETPGGPMCSTTISVRVE